MNSARDRPVEASIFRPSWVTKIAAVLVAIGSSACIEIDGGAVELSWSLRSFDGDSVGSCEDAFLSQVRVCWQPADAAGEVSCTPAQSDAFPCGEANGVSGFEIEPGPTAFWIEPVCRDGAPAASGTYQVPPPIVRTVEEGRIVTLDSLLIVVTPRGDPCQPAGCTCVRQ